MPKSGKLVTHIFPRKTSGCPITTKWLYFEYNQVVFSWTTTLFYKGQPLVVFGNTVTLPVFGNQVVVPYGQPVVLFVYKLLYSGKVQCTLPAYKLLYSNTTSGCIWQYNHCIGAKYNALYPHTTTLPQFWISVACIRARWLYSVNLPDLDQLARIQVVCPIRAKYFGFGESGCHFGLIQVVVFWVQPWLYFENKRGCIRIQQI